MNAGISARCKIGAYRGSRVQKAMAVFSLSSAHVCMMSLSACMHACVPVYYSTPTITLFRVLCFVLYQVLFCFVTFLSCVDLPPRPTLPRSCSFVQQEL